MKFLKGVLFISPIILGIILLFIKIIIGIESKPTSFNLLQFLFVENLQFSLSIMIIVIQYLIGIMIFYSENQKRISGSWNIVFSPTRWKGADQAKIIGKGSLHLSKSSHSANEYHGFMYLNYFDETNNPIIRGIYEVHFRLKRNNVSGQSLLIWGDNTSPTDIDSPYVKPCVYDLRLTDLDSKIEGNAKMLDSETASKIVGYRQY